jgi:hypothetical protein
MNRITDITQKLFGYKYDYKPYIKNLIKLFIRKSKIISNFIDKEVI